MYEGPKRKPRILFKVDAEEAYLLIPRHAEDPYLIVGDIGRFTVRNQFKYDGEEGTYSHRHKLKTEPVVIPSPMQTPTKINTSLSLSSSPATQPTGSESGRLFTSKGGNPGAVPYTELSKGPCLLDCIEVKLMDCDVFTARRVPIRLANGDKSFRIVREVSIFVHGSTFCAHMIVAISCIHLTMYPYETQVKNSNDKFLFFLRWPLITGRGATARPPVSRPHTQ